MLTCFVPTLSAISSDCRPLFALARQIEGQTEVKFDFSTCRFLRAEAVAFIGGLIRLIQERGGVVYVYWETIPSAVRANLAQNGFLRAFGLPDEPWVGNSIPYLEHAAQDPFGFSSYIRAAWLSRGWVGMSELLINQITSNVSEAYVNAFEHSGSPVGVHCCGQHYPKRKRLSLTMVDFGVGIPFKVRQFKAAETGLRKLSAQNCLEWAFQSGTSTRLGGMSGGLGLYNLCQFVTLNRGKLDFYSHEGRAEMQNGTLSFTEMADHCPGSMVTVELLCDDRYYLLGSELQSYNPFTDHDDPFR